MQKAAGLIVVALLGFLLMQQLDGVFSPTPVPDPPPAPEPDPVPPSPSPMPDHFRYGQVNHATAEELQQAIQCDCPLLVKFGANWCGPCKSLQPNLKRFADAAGGDVMVLSMELTERGNKAVFEGYGIKSLPTMVVMRGDNDLGRRTGVLSAKGISRFVDEALNAH